MNAKLAAALTLALAATSVQAARKPCIELLAAIEANLQAKGVQNYVLESVTNAEVGTRKVVGSCDGGEGKIVYAREGTPAAADAEPSADDLGAPTLGNY